MDKRLEGTVAIVTGGGIGKGDAICLSSVAQGATVIVSGITEDRPTQAASDIRTNGGQASAIRTDVSHRENCQEMVDAAFGAHGRFDILVNIAGIGEAVRFLDIRPEQWDRMIGINLAGVQHAVRRVLESGIDGRIVNVSSIAGQRGGTGRGLHGIAKAGVKIMTKIQAIEFGDRDIRVNAIAPGPIDTALIHAAHTPETVAAYRHLTLMRCFGLPEKVTGAAVSPRVRRKSLRLWPSAQRRWGLHRGRMHGGGLMPALDHRTEERFMKNLEGKVAVVTGAGSGLGRAIAIECDRRGMRLVLSDIDIGAVESTCAKLCRRDAVAIRCDVSRPDEVKRLADASYDHFGCVNLLVNNAGVGTGGRIWNTTPSDWAWVIGVNLMGIVHGIQSFVPRMLASGEPSHVVNTASAGGFTVSPGFSIYMASKHAVVALTEALYHEMQLEEAARVGVSVLCPAYVETGFAHGEKTRPARFSDAGSETAVYMGRFEHAKGEIDAGVVATATLDAVESDHFYILTHDSVKPAIEVRMRDILEGRNPSKDAVRRIGVSH